MKITETILHHSHLLEKKWLLPNQHYISYILLFQACFKHRTLHVPNQMQMSESNRFFLFALDSAQVKFNVRNGPYHPYSMLAHGIIIIYKYNM